MTRTRPAPSPNRVQCCALRLALIAVLAGPLLSGSFLAGPVLADTAVSFGGLKTDPAAPLRVTADRLSVSQGDGAAVFTGNVVVTQSTMELRAAVVKVRYNVQTRTIAELQASGGVTLKAEANAAASDEATYNVLTTELVMKGNVILTSAQATIAGPVLTMNLTSGLGTMSGGRVASTFNPAKN